MGLGSWVSLITALIDPGTIMGSFARVPSQGVDSCLFRSVSPSWP
jgi:hypothetical protein